MPKHRRQTTQSLLHGTPYSTVLAMTVSLDIIGESLFDICCEDCAKALSTNHSWIGSDIALFKRLFKSVPLANKILDCTG